MNSIKSQKNEKEKQLKKYNKYLVVTVLVILALVLALTGCRGNKKTKTTTTAEVNYYTYFKFANVNPTANSDMLPDGQIGSWMGYYYGTEATMPKVYSYYTWIKIQGNDGINGRDGVDGVGINGTDGMSAYEIAIMSGAIPGDMTQDEWIASLKGADGESGANGESAYEIAIRTGKIPATMSETEWIESLQGKDGKDGQDGASGQSATGTSYGMRAKIDSLQVASNGLTSNVYGSVIESGDYVYLLKLYCTVPNTPMSVNVSWSGCSPVNSIASGNKYFVESGDVTVANSQVVMVVPIAPYFKNMFEAGDHFSISVTGLTVALAAVENAMF